MIDATIKDAIGRARSHLARGPGLRHCAECGVEIPAAHRLAVASLAGR
jgi:RNA polymerase-binding transcription factor DksA